MCDRCATLNEPFGTYYCEDNFFVTDCGKFLLCCRRRPWPGSQTVAQEDLIVKILVKKMKHRKHLQIRTGYAAHTAVHDETDMTYDMPQGSAGHWVSHWTCKFVLRRQGVTLTWLLLPYLKCHYAEWLASCKGMIARCPGASYTQC